MIQTGSFPKQQRRPPGATQDMGTLSGGNARKGDRFMFLHISMDVKKTRIQVKVKVRALFSLKFDLHL